MLRLMIAAFVFSSTSGFAADFVHVDGKRFSVKLAPTECIPDGMGTVLGREAMIVKQEMLRGECRALSRLGDATLDCAAIDPAYVAKARIVSAFQEADHCSCSTGPSACVERCKSLLSELECKIACLGNCALPLPNK